MLQCCPMYHMSLMIYPIMRHQITISALVHNQNHGWPPWGICTTLLLCFSRFRSILLFSMVIKGLAVSKLLSPADVFWWRVCQPQNPMVINILASSTTGVWTPASVKEAIEPQVLCPHASPSRAGQRGAGDTGDCTCGPQTISTRARGPRTCMFKSRADAGGQGGVVRWQSTCLYPCYPPHQQADWACFVPSGITSQGGGRGKTVPSTVQVALPMALLQYRLDCTSSYFDRPKDV